MVATSNQIMPAMACSANERRFIPVQVAPKRLDLLNKEYFMKPLCPDARRYKLSV